MARAREGERRMNCGDLERWLEEGLPAGSAAAARAHAAECARCAPAWRAAIEMESLLAAPPPPAPAGFTARVMARVAGAIEARARSHTPLPAPLPWWVRAPAEPACALAALLAGLALWQRDALWSVAGELARHLGHGIQGAANLMLLSSPAPPFDRPEIILGLTLAALPAAGWGSWALFRWTYRRVEITAAGFTRGVTG